jgi:hypothetical protein
MGILLTPDILNSYPVSAISSAAQGLAENGWQGLFGKVSPETQQNLINTEKNDLIQASAGTLTPDQALAIATQDVTGQLTAAGANPIDVQTVLNKIVGGGETLIVVAIIVLGLILLIKVT